MRTYGHDGADSRFSHFCKTPLMNPPRKSNSLYRFVTHIKSRLSVPTHSRQHVSSTRLFSLHLKSEHLFTAQESYSYSQQTFGPQM
jgi:hypothetical protein